MLIDNNFSNVESESESLRDRKKQKAREQILEAAIQLFSKKKFEEIKVEDIADLAFVSRATVYNYFKNKNELYFGIGIHYFDNINQTLIRNFPSHLKGRDQILALATGSINRLFENTLIQDIVNAFFQEINANNYPIEEMHDKIFPKMNLSPENISKLSETEKILIDLYLRLLQYSEIWIQAVRNGKQDRTITNTMPDEHIVQFILFLISGLINQMKLRYKTLERINFSFDNQKKHIVTIIQKFLVD